MSRAINVGGQAVIEGVMMRSPRSYCVAVRRPQGDIVLRESLWRSVFTRYSLWRWPFFRGIAVMAESMMNGVSALNFSAKHALPEEEQGNGEEGSASTVLPMVLSVIAAIALFKFVPHMAAVYTGKWLYHADWTVNDPAYHVVDAVAKVVLFVAYVAAISLMRDIRRVFMYHGAEHKAIAAYESGAPLDVAHARSQTRLHLRCGTSFLMVVIIVFMLVSALLLPWLPEGVKPGVGKPWYLHVVLVVLKLPLLLPVAGIAYEFNRLAAKHPDWWVMRPLLWPGLAMQLLTTREPDDDQLEIALVALRASLWREQQAQRNQADTAQTVEGEGDRVFADFAAFCADPIGAATGG